MSRVFADTHFFVALLSRRDARHERAVETYRSGDFAEFVTTVWVLAELADGMSRPVARSLCQRFVQRLREREDTKIMDADPNLFWRGFELYGQRPDKEWSLTDCISFVVMEDEGLSEALTGDRHFEQAGFVALLA
jgi:predicted nucleic acid-binding protein